MYAQVSTLKPIAGEIGGFPFASMGVRHDARQKRRAAESRGAAHVPVWDEATTSVDRLEEYVAERVLGAGLEAEIDDAVEDLLDDERYHELRAPFLALASAQVLAAVAQGGSAPAWLVNAVPADQHETVKVVDRLMRLQAQATLSFFAEFAKHAGHVDFDEVLAASRPPMWFLIDPAVPGAVKSVLLARERVDIYMFAVSASAERKTPPGLVRTLLHRWIADQSSFLGLLAVLPGVDLPESDVPSWVRLNLDSIAREHDDAERAYQKRLATARTRDASTVFGTQRDDGLA